MKQLIIPALFSLIIFVIFYLNKYFAKPKGLYIGLVVSFIMLVFGLIIKSYCVWAYRLLLIPFIEISILALLHLCFRKFLKIPFIVYLGANGFHKEYEKNETDFTDILSGCFSILLVFVLIIIVVMIVGKNAF